MTSSPPAVPSSFISQRLEVIPMLVRRGPLATLLAGFAFFAAAGRAPASPGPVVINEIHYAPADKTVAEEFVELHNEGLDPVDLSGWRFSAGIGFEFPG